MWILLWSWFLELLWLNLLEVALCELAFLGSQCHGINIVDTYMGTGSLVKYVEAISLICESFLIFLLLRWSLSIVGLVSCLWKMWETLELKVVELSYQKQSAVLFFFMALNIPKWIVSQKFISVITAHFNFIQSCLWLEITTTITSVVLIHLMLSI